MRLESCRKCGTQMVPHEEESEQCIVCHAPTRLYCKQCDALSEVQVHPHIFEQPIGEKPLLILKGKSGRR